MKRTTQKRRHRGVEQTGHRLTLRSLETRFSSKLTLLLCQRKEIRLHGSISINRPMAARSQPPQHKPLPTSHRPALPSLLQPLTPKHNGRTQESPRTMSRSRLRQRVPTPGRLGMTRQSSPRRHLPPHNLLEWIRTATRQSSNNPSSLPPSLPPSQSMAAWQTLPRKTSSHLGHHH